MKVQFFTYTKSNGEVSEREVVVVSEPSNHVEGYDITSMEPANFGAFSVEYAQTLNRQKSEMLELMAKYDLTHSYRRFTPSSMTNVESEYF